MTGADEGMAGRGSTLSTGAAWALVGHVVSMGMALGVSSAAARVMSTDAFGRFVVSLTLVAGLSFVVEAGMPPTVTRLLASSVSGEAPSEGRSLVKKSATINTFAGLIVLIALVSPVGQVTLAQLLPNEATLHAGVLIGLLAFLRAFQSLAADTFRGLHDIRSATLHGPLGALGSIPTTLVAAACLMGVTAAGLSIGLIGVLQIMAFAMGVAALVAFWHGVGWLRGTSLASRQDYYSLSKLGAPLAINRLATLGLAHIDMWLVGILVEPMEVAVYGAARLLVPVIGAPLMIANQVVPPVIARRAVSGDPKDLERVIRGSAGIGTVLATAGLVALWIMGSDVLALLFGAEFAAGWTVLGILATGKWASVYFGSCGKTLAMTGRQSVLAYIAVMSTALTGSLAYLGIVRYGMVGAASAAAIGSILQNIAMWAMVRRTVGVWTHGGIRPAAQAGRSLMHEAARMVGGRPTV